METIDIESVIKSPQSIVHYLREAPNDSLKRDSANMIEDLSEQLAIAHAQAKKDALELDRLNSLINTPELHDFAKGVVLEAAHQVDRWGASSDRSKSAENWLWLVGYLAGKALRAAITGDKTKALHHTVSSAAVLANWHAAIKADTTGAGIGLDVDIKPQADGGYEGVNQKQQEAA